MTGLRVALAVFAFLLPGASAVAESGAPAEDPYTRPGFYFQVGANLISQLWGNDLAASPGIGNVDVDQSVGINASIGWRFLPWLAAEFNYEGVKGYDTHVSNLPDFRMDSHTLTANARIYYPMERWQPYALLGVGMAHFDLHKNSLYEMKGSSINVGGRLGVGLDYYVTEHVVLNANFSTLLTGFEIRTPAGNDVDGIYYLSTGIGVSYRF